jgi:hypothetical protein
MADKVDGIQDGCIERSNKGAHARVHVGDNRPTKMARKARKVDGTVNS